MSARALTPVDAGTGSIPRGKIQPRKCAVCPAVFKPEKSRQTCCTRSCAARQSNRKRGPTSEIEERLPDDLVWRRRNLPMEAVHEFARPFPINSINKNLLRRGWRHTVVGHGYSVVTAAPCRDCGRHAVPIEQLNDRRQCRICKPLFLLPTERAS